MRAPVSGEAPDRVVPIEALKIKSARSSLSLFGSTCAACRRPTSRWSAICRQCLATHYRLDGLIRAQEILDEVAQ